MNKEKQTLDLSALLVFFPSVVALAIIPILMRATLVTSRLIEDVRYFSGTYDEESKLYSMVDIYSQCKALAVVVFAVAMLVVALLCCKYLFKRVEKRSFIYVGASAAFVLLSLASALSSSYENAAFFGVFDRAEGFFTTACYFVMFLFTMYAFKKTQNFRYVAAALMICTGINIVIGLFQYTGNNLFTFDWFATYAVDSDYRDILQLNIDTATEKGKMYGALYHYNYVGSFMGMVIPLFSVLAIYGKTVLHKILYAVFAAGSLFMLLASTARSGLIALATAFVVGLIVFARVLIRRWKVTVSVVAAVAVLAVGANFAMDNALFRRIPSLVNDVVDFIAPSDATDLFDSLPIREISHNSDGSVSFTTQTDKLNIAFDGTELEYVFTDNAGERLTMSFNENGFGTIADTDFPQINFEFVSSDGNPYYNDAFYVWFDGRDDSALLFKLFNEKQIHMLDLNVGDRTTVENAEAIGFEGKEKLGSSRGYIWSRTIPLLENCIVTGYGPDNFVYVFPQNDYLAKFYAYTEGFYVTVDKPHNLYLQIAVNNGIIALVAFLVICVFYLIDSLRLYALKKEYRIEQVYGISIMLGIVGYLAAGLFNDSVVSVAPVFWILLGVGAALNSINRRIDRGEDPDAEIIPIRRKSKKELQREAAVEQQASDLAASIRGEQAEQRAADRRRMEEVMEKYKAAAEAEAAANKARAEKRKQRELEAENAPPKPKKETISKQEADDMLARVRALKEKKETEKEAALDAIFNNTDNKDNEDNAT